MPDELTPLSDRETEIVRLLATGATNLQIAQELGISANTVKVHLRNIYAKLDVGSRTEATMVAIREGWVDVPRTTEEAGQKTTTEEPDAAIVALPATERWSRVPLVKRVGLSAALLLALAYFLLPQLLRSRANGESPDPVMDVFPTATASSSSSSNRWRARAQMPTSRNGLGVVAHDGLIYALAGVDNEGVTDKVEVYDPELDTWFPGTSKPTPVGFVSAAVLGNCIYVPGGMGNGQEPQAVLEVYNPQLDTWESRAPMPSALSAYSLATLDENLYLFGGLGDEGYVDSVYRYDPAADQWESRAAMDGARAFASAAVIEDAIYVAGGFDGEAELNTCQAYHPATDTWTTHEPMTQRRGGLAMVAVRETLYTIGGGMEGNLAFNERYDPRTDTWSRLETPLTETWRGLGLAYIKPNIYAVGGWNGRNLNVNEAYQALFVIMVP